jgi:Fe-S-cluster containining protein
LDEDEEIFTEIPLNSAVQRFLDGVLRVRRDLYIDPRLCEPWSCNPDRCRPLLGKNLCCKVEVRCPYLDNERCAIQAEKPFSCALFPLDLVRVGGVRIVTTVANSDFFLTGWSRFDRDMLRCFDGEPTGRCSMFEAQQDVLQKVFTQSEMTLMQRRIEALAARTPPQDWRPKSVFQKS